MSNTQQVSGQQFNSLVSDSDVPVLVDFYADWCGPCRLMAPVLDRIAEDYADRLKVAKVNVETDPMLAARYQVQSIPTLILFNEGEAVAQHVGLLTPGQLDAMLGEHAASAGRS